MLSVSEAVNDVLVTSGSLPEHDTTELIREGINAGLNQGLNLLRGDIVAREGSGAGSRKTNVELGLLVGAVLDDIDPLGVVEADGAVGKVGGSTGRGVVELNPEEIKDRVGDSVAELGIGDGALGGTGDVVGLIGSGVVLAHTVDESSPANAAIGLDIDVKSVNNDALERTGVKVGEQGKGPGKGGLAGVVRTERVPEEVGEPLGNFITGEGLASGRATANGEEDLLASGLALGDILPDLVATRQERGVREEGSITLVGKVGAGEVTDGLGVLIDEANVNDIH